MAKQKFVHFVPRDKPPKLGPGRHKKNLNKSEKRNKKLSQTDWRACSDLNLSSEWSTYRQALRDLPANSTPTLDSDGNLQNVTWPSEPS